MILRRLRVRNIRSYESASLAFEGGTTLLVGDVGSGKTSLLYAIEMALFGVAEVNGAYLVRHGAKDAEVAVEFEGPGTKYEVSRRFRRLRKKGQETFEAERIRFTVDGTETSYSATELRQQVIDLLGFPDNPSPQAHSDLWRWAVYVPQERMRDILAARPQERLETVRKALGVERYRTAAENAQDLAADLRRSAASRRAEADRLRHFDEEFVEAGQLVERLRTDRSAKVASVADLERSLAELRARRAELESELRSVEGDLRESATLQRDVETDRQTFEERRQLLDRRRAEWKARTEELGPLAAEADQLDVRQAALLEVQHEIRSARTQLESIQGDLARLAETRARAASGEAKVAELRHQLDLRRAEEVEAGRALERANSEGPSKEPPAPTPEPLPTLDEKLDLARRDEAAALQAMTRAEGEVAELDELLSGGVCPRCHQAVSPSDFEPHRSEARNAADAARAKFSQRSADRTRLEEVRRARERFERALERWREVERLRSDARTVRDRAALARGDTEENLARASVEFAELRSRLTALQPAEEHETALRSSLDVAEKTRSERSDLLERSRLAAERRDGVMRATEMLSGETRRLAAETEGISARLEERVRRISELKEARARAATVRAAVDSLDSELRSSEEAVSAGRALLARLDTLFEETNRRIRAAEDGRRERASLLAEAQQLDEKAAWVGTPFRAIVLGMEQKLLTHAQVRFEREFARYFACLVDDPGLLARTDPAFTPLVMIEGEWTPAEALSGGERTSLALAFRLALAHVVRSMGSLHLDTLLLDEPTDGFSPEQVVRMGELLEELALPQVILVSHEAQLAAVADRVVRVRKVDGRSVLSDGGPGADPDAPRVPTALDGL